MQRFWAITAALVCALAACVQLQPTPEDLQARRFDPTPGKAVIYLVRTNPDIGDAASTLWLDDRLIGTTYQGSYVRMEVNPGSHRIRGYAPDTGAITLDVAADRMYFVRQTVVGGAHATNPQSSFITVDERWARSVIAQSELAAVIR
jgi:hypothetical protein